jgi:hypothetical protein
LTWAAENEHQNPKRGSSNSHVCGCHRAEKKAAKGLGCSACSLRPRPAGAVSPLPLLAPVHARAHHAGQPLPWASGSGPPSVLSPLSWPGGQIEKKSACDAREPVLHGLELAFEQVRDASERSSAAQAAAHQSTRRPSCAAAQRATEACITTSWVCARCTCCATSLEPFPLHVDPRGTACRDRGQAEGEKDTETPSTLTHRRIRCCVRTAPPAHATKPTAALTAVPATLAAEI